MVVFEELISDLEKLKRDMPYLVEFTLKDQYIQKQMIDMNQEQMYDGKDSFEDDIQPEYTEAYKKYHKRKRGDPEDRVTLLDKGDFYDAMKVVYDASQITLTSSDIKTKKLEKRYGEGIFGLIDPNVDKIREEMFAIIRYKIISKYFPYLD